MENRLLTVSLERAELISSAGTTLFPSSALLPNCGGEVHEWLYVLPNGYLLRFQTRGKVLENRQGGAVAVQVAYVSAGNILTAGCV